MQYWYCVRSEADVGLMLSRTLQQCNWKDMSVYCERELLILELDS